MPVQLFRRKENPIDTPGTCSMLLGYSLWFLSSSSVWENNNDYHEAGEDDEDDDDVGATLLNMKGKKGYLYLGLFICRMLLYWVYILEIVLKLTLILMYVLLLRYNDISTHFLGNIRV